MINFNLNEIMNTIQDTKDITLYSLSELSLLFFTSKQNTKHRVNK